MAQGEFPQELLLVFPSLTNPNFWQPQIELPNSLGQVDFTLSTLENQKFPHLEARVLKVAIFISLNKEDENCTNEFSLTFLALGA